MGPMTETVVARAPTETWPVLAGCFSFGGTLALSTATQLKFLGVSTGTRPPMIPTTLGFATVCLASLASHKAAIVTHTAMEQFKAKKNLSSPSLVGRRLYRETRDHPQFDLNKEYNWMLSSVRDSWGDGGSVDLGGFVQIPKHTLRICVVGLLAFKLLGGRFWGISPSSYTNIGSFARRGIPATDAYATAAQGATIEKFGRLHGCHTCGSKQFFLPPSSKKFVGDHMPPKSVANQINARWYNKLVGRTARFRFYPQCVPCSNRQGSILSKAVQQNNKNLARAGGGGLAHFHGLRPRWNHLSGGVVAGVTIVGATNDDIAKGNPKRYRQLQRQVEESLKHVWF